MKCLGAANLSKEAPRTTSAPSLAQFPRIRKDLVGEMQGAAPAQINEHLTLLVEKRSEIICTASFFGLQDWTICC